MRYEKTTERSIHAINDSNEFIGSIRLHGDEIWRFGATEYHSLSASELFVIGDKLNELNKKP